MKTYHKVLTIAGSDSGGGAGVQADLKTFSALGCYGMSAVTALTAQNTRGVTGIHPVPPAFVGEQIDAVLNDIGADAIKIGMLYSAELIAVVADRLMDYRTGKIVLDPVMAAQSGHKLIQEDAVDAIRDRLMPLCAMVTPNTPEAGLLTGITIGSVEDMKTAARMISGWGCPNVLVKGGHLETARCPDILYMNASDRFVLIEEDRIGTRNTHGTGCTLSSAVAAFLAKGESVEAAVRLAKTYVHGAIHAGKDYVLGRGHGPVHHFFGFWS